MLATGNKIRKLSFLLADAIAQVRARNPKLKQHFGYVLWLLQYVGTPELQQHFGYVLWLLQSVGSFDCEILRGDASSIGIRFITQNPFLPRAAMTTSAQGCDTVLTIGGIQSNHARATALLAQVNCMRHMTRDTSHLLI